MHNHYLHFTTTSQTVLSKSSKNAFMIQSSPNLSSQECFHSQVIAKNAFIHKYSQYIATHKLHLSLQVYFRCAIEKN